MILILDVNHYTTLTMFSFEFSSNSTKKIVVMAYTRVCFLYLSFSLSRAQRTKDSSRYGLRLAAAPCIEIKRKQSRGVDAFIIRRFNLSDTSRPVTGCRCELSSE